MVLYRDGQMLLLLLLLNLKEGREAGKENNGLNRARQSIEAPIKLNRLQKQQTR